MPKRAAYEGVRKAYAGEFDWPAELDEIEPGPARTPRWLNRLHWAVADLVQAGILEKSGGSDGLRATAMGKGSSRSRHRSATAPDPRVAGAVAAARTDPADNAVADEALTGFQARFPADRLADMSLQDYAIGGGDQDNFCWWLERALRALGGTASGSSRGHIIYRQKDGSTTCRRNWPRSTPEQAMAEVASWHAEGGRAAAAARLPRQRMPSRWRNPSAAGP